jgi:hypothetical protein
MWVVKYGCASLSQILNTHLTDDYSSAAPQTPRNRLKRGHKSPAHFALRAKNGANSWKTVRLFVRFLKLNGSEAWRFKEKIKTIPLLAVKNEANDRKKTPFRQERQEPTAAAQLTRQSARILVLRGAGTR